MSSESTLILAGILIIVTPFIGIPVEWYVYIFTILGLVVLGIGLLLRSCVQKTSAKSDSQNMSDVDNVEENKNNKISPIA